MLCICRSTALKQSIKKELNRSYGEKQIKKRIEWLPFLLKILKLMGKSETVREEKEDKDHGNQRRQRR